MLQMVQHKARSTGRNQQVSDIRHQKAERDKESIVAELDQPALSPQQRSDQQNRGYESGVDNLQKLGQRRIPEALQPNSGMGSPDDHIPSIQSQIVGLAPEGRNQNAHLL